MSRNDMFLLFACLCAAAIMAGGPTPLLRAPPVEIVSLAALTKTGPVTADSSMLQQSLDRQ